MEFNRINNNNLRYKYFEKNGLTIYNRTIIEVSNICNHQCVQCAYTKFNKYPKKIMLQEEFENIINQLTEFGYTYFCICPYLGENLSDKDFFKKIDFLEKHPSVDGYDIFTNLTLWDKKQIEKLKELKKIFYLSISIYGYNRDEFLKMTRTTNNVFDKFIENIDYLIELNPPINFHIRFYSSEKQISKLIRGENYKRALTIKIKFPCDFYSDNPGSTWSGLVDDKSLNMLNYSIFQNKLCRSEMCAHVISKNTVFVNGDFILCGAYDTFRNSKLGNLFEKNINEILNNTNKKYFNWMKKYQSSCDSCNIYTPISSIKIHNTDVEIAKDIYEKVKK